MSAPIHNLKALQDPNEVAAFAALLHREGVLSYLEVGSKFGGSLWSFATALPKGSLIVAVDLATAHSKPHLEKCCEDLRARGYRVHLFLGDSTDKKIIAAVRALGPFDACFIDANHTLPYVTADWENYGPMAGIVAFHDIAFVPEGDRTGRLPIDIPKFWESIKHGYEHTEIRLCPTKKNNGIGVLWKR